jgi:diguanylate cyclase (GGDEF)-like protein
MSSDRPHLHVVPPPGPPSGPAEPPREETDEALDMVAALLRALAQTTTLPVAAESLDAWARHLLVLTPAPGTEGDAAASRDWAHARTSAVVHIRREAADHAQAIGDLQDVAWSVVEGTARLISTDAQLDRRTEESLGRLRAALARPAHQLKHAVAEALDSLTEVVETRNTRERAVDGQLAIRLASLSSELEATRREASLDALTGLANRGSLDRELQHATALHALSGEPLCVMVVDLDDFKRVNDARGHATGDDAIRLAAGVLAKSFPRSSDVVARYGGDEFVVILRFARLADCRRLAERFLDRLYETEIPGDDGALRLTASVGVAEATAADTSATLLKRADEALYRAKELGKNRVALAGDGIAGA